MPSVRVSDLDADVFAFHVTQDAKPFPKGGQSVRHGWTQREKADPSALVRGLRMGAERHRDETDRAGEQTATRGRRNRPAHGFFSFTSSSGPE